MIKHSIHANIAINECNFNHLIDVNTPKPLKTTTPMVTNPVERIEIDRSKVDELSKKKQEENKKKENEQKKKKAKTKIILEAKPKKLDYKCKTCNASTFKEDIKKCSECGKEICSNCATMDIETNDIVCTECWSKLE
jgi:DNA-directed RNA polymerase subunit RPC12/RpoP